MTATVCCHYSTLLCVSLSLSLKSSKSESVCSVTSFSQSTGRCVCFPAARWCLSGVWNLYLCIGPFGVLHYLCPPLLGSTNTQEGMMDGCEDGWLCWGETLHSAVHNFHTVSWRWLTGTALPVCVPVEAVAILSLLSQSIVFVSQSPNNNYPLGCCWTSDLVSYEDTQSWSKSQDVIPQGVMSQQRLQSLTLRFWDSSPMVSNCHTVFCSVHDGLLGIWKKEANVVIDMIILFPISFIKRWLSLT